MQFRFSNCFDAKCFAFVEEKKIGYIHQGIFTKKVSRA